MPQSMYSKDYVAGDDWILHAYNLYDAAKCVWWLEQLGNVYDAHMRLPIVKIRRAPADKVLAMRRAASWNSMPVQSPSSFGCLVLNTYEEEEAPSVARLYADLMSNFKYEDPQYFSPVMLGIMQETHDDRTCTLCSERMQASHWTSEPHRKKLRWSKKVEEHKWNAEICFWEDVPLAVL